MRPQFYTDELKRYARFVRSFHPEQQTAPNMVQRIAVGPSDGDTAYTEGVMKAWSEKDWSWDIEGLSLHSYTTVRWPPAYDSLNFGEQEYARAGRAQLGSGNVHLGQPFDDSGISALFPLSPLNQNRRNDDDIRRIDLLDRSLGFDRHAARRGKRAGSGRDDLGAELSAAG